LEHRYHDRIDIASRAAQAAELDRGCRGRGAEATGARGAACALLDVNDPAAIKVSYLLEASHLDMKLHPNYVVGSRCENCMLILDKPGYAYRPCSLFPGKLVKTSGWCTSWAPQI
jgi:hypothetical protein